MAKRTTLQEELMKEAYEEFKRSNMGKAVQMQSQEILHEHIVSVLKGLIKDIKKGTLRVRAYEYARDADDQDGKGMCKPSNNFSYLLHLEDIK